MGGDPAPGFLAHRWLLVAATGGAVAEAALLAVVAPAAQVLAPQVTGLAPLAVYHDLRWLYGYGLPWPVFAGGAIMLVVARSAANAGLARLAWPAGSMPPPPLVLWWSSAALTALTGALLSPVVALMFGASVVPFSWPFLASLAAMVLLMLPVSHGGVLARWWQALPPAAAAGWLFADFAVLTLAAVAIARLPAVGGLVAAGLAGLFNARAWYGVTSAVAHGRQRAPGHLPLAPIAAVGAVALVIAATRLAFYAGVHNAAPRRSSAASVNSAATNVSPARAASTSRGLAAPPGAGGHREARRSPRGRVPVLVLAGFGSSCCNHAGDVHRVLPARWVQQFSYRGLSKTGQPLPHGPRASDLPLPLLGNRVAAQVWRLHRETGRAVDVIAESEGTLAVDAMIALHPRVPLGSVVLLSPIIAPGQDSYPTLAGASPALVAGTELRGVIWFVGGLSPFGTAGAQTFVNSVDSVGARFAAVAHQRLARSLEFVPLADAVTLPACVLPANVQVVPAFHGELLGDPAVLESVRAFLSHQPVRGRPGLRTAAEIVSAGAAAWRMPQQTSPSPPCPRLRATRGALAVAGWPWRARWRLAA